MAQRSATISSFRKIDRTPLHIISDLTVEPLCPHTAGSETLDLGRKILGYSVLYNPVTTVKYA